MEAGTMDKVVSIIVGLGVPGLVLLVAMDATGYAGAAAVTTSLAALGPVGMLGGIAFLLVLSVISKGIAEFGFGAIHSAVLKELRKRGETSDGILAKIEGYPISRSLKDKLRGVLTEQGPSHGDDSQADL